MIKRIVAFITCQNNLLLYVYKLSLIGDMIIKDIHLVTKHSLMIIFLIILELIVRRSVFSSRTLLLLMLNVIYLLVHVSIPYYYSWPRIKKSDPRKKQSMGTYWVPLCMYIHTPTHITQAVILRTFWFGGKIARVVVVLRRKRWWLMLIL